MDATWGGKRPLTATPRALHLRLPRRRGTSRCSPPRIIVRCQPPPPSTGGHLLEDHPSRPRRRLHLPLLRQRREADRRLGRLPGRHPITRLSPLVEPDGRRAHEAHHRSLQIGAWSRSGGGRRSWSSRRCPQGQLRLARHRPPQDLAFVNGLTLVSVALPPWGGMPLPLPVGVRPHRRQGSTPVKLAAAMLREPGEWSPERELEVVADGASCPLARASPGIRPGLAHLPGRGPGTAEGAIGLHPAGGSRARRRRCRCTILAAAARTLISSPPTPRRPRRRWRSPTPLGGRSRGPLAAARSP